MLILSVSLAVFGLGMPLAAPATPAIGDPLDPVDYRCGIISIEENAGHPLSSELIEGLFLESPGPQLRVATLDVNLSAELPGELATQLSGGQDPRAQQAATAIGQSHADVLLLTDFDADEQALRIFNDEYLRQAQPDTAESDYPYRYVGPSNKGVPSGADLDQDKIVGGAADAWGRGEFPGQGSMVLLSKHPIDQERIKTVTELRWADMPDSAIAEAKLSETVVSAMPVMESGLWDIPVQVAGQEIRVIAVRVDRDQDNAHYAQPRRGDQLNVIGDWVAAADYLRSDNGAKPPTDGAYVVLGELGQGTAQNSSVDRLLEKIGVAEQGVHDESNYILPDNELEILRHGSIGLTAPEATGTEPASPTGATTELLWSDLKF